MNSVLASVVIDYKKNSLKFGNERISSQPGMTIWLMKLTENIFLLCDGQRRLIADCGYVRTTFINPNTPPEVLLSALNDLNLQHSLSGEVSWVKQVRALGELKKKAKGGNLMDLVKESYVTRSISVLFLLFYYFFYYKNNFIIFYYFILGIHWYQ